MGADKGFCGEVDEEYRDGGRGGEGMGEGEGRVVRRAGRVRYRVGA